MSYAVEFTELAGEKLQRLVESLPKTRRAAAVQGVEEALEVLAYNPRLAPRVHLGRPTYRFSFRAGGTTYHWAATYYLSEDETGLIITEIYRIKL